MVTTQLLSLVFITVMQAITLIFVLYIIKSAIGINIFEHYSFAVWGWFKSIFLDLNLVSHYLHSC